MIKAEQTTTSQTAAHKRKIGQVDAPCNLLVDFAISFVRYLILARDKARDDDQFSCPINGIS